MAERVQSWRYATVYRGVKLEARRGKTHGHHRLTVGGVDQGEWIGSDLVKAVESNFGYVDQAIERPDAYGEHWHPQEGTT